MLLELFLSIQSPTITDIQVTTPIYQNYGDNPDMSGQPGTPQDSQASGTR